MSHGIVKCPKCKIIIRQCRCLEHNKVTWEFCGKCDIHQEGETMPERMSDEKFEELFSPMQLSENISSKTWLRKEANRAREAEKEQEGYVQEYKEALKKEKKDHKWATDTTREVLVINKKLEKENAELKQSISDIKKNERKLQQDLIICVDKYKKRGD